ncbi:MAG: protein-glutamate O-methyltransferase CheR [Pseudomonadales bacterium]|nr:protein-glutamate O-methyltransferase CheR [Pseudomonadales bacterium]
MFGNGVQSKKDQIEDYEAFRLFLENACGILLGDNKHYLVQSRLKKLLKEKEILSLRALIGEIESQPFSTLKQATIDAMTTNETLWFRDRHPFDHLISTLFKERAKASNNDIRIWSAACSYGQEPYSLSMCADEARKSGQLPIGSNVRIVATHISKEALDQARLGHYESLALGRGLSPERLKFNFSEMDNGEWELKAEIKRRVEFRTLNLQDSYSLLGKFDIIFCRNVLIYFSSDFKADILTRMHACIKPGGYLFLGGSESLHGLTDIYEMVQTHPGLVYRAR